MSTRLSPPEIVRLVNRYIGVREGYLGDFTYRSHADFYPEYCDLAIDPERFEGTTRSRFIAILESAEPGEQAAIVRGVLKRFPVGASNAPETRTQALANELGLLADRLDGAGVVQNPTPRHSSTVVRRALADAEALLASTGATSGVDRLHTALHGHLIAVAASADIALPKDASLAAVYAILLDKHDRLIPSGPRADDIRRVQRAIAAIIGALEPVRNRASVAHPNESLLAPPEATLVINASRTVLAYLDTKVLE